MPTASIDKFDHVMGDSIELTRSMGMGSHHALPLDPIASVDDKVHLVVTEDEAKNRWTEAHH